MRSESIAELAKALAKAQGEMKGALRDSQNPYFKSTYADLASVWDAIKEPFTKNGLSFVQAVTFDPQFLIMYLLIRQCSIPPANTLGAELG